MRSAVAAAVGLALVPLSQAWNVELPPCLDDFKPFVSSGCFQDGPDPTLIFRSGLDQHNMTVEKCVADCKGNGFRYAGLEYYGVCFCGSTVNGPQVPDSQCSLPCSGNKSETCGGDKALSIWQDPTFAKSPEDVTVDDYKSLGCFTDNSTKGRTLSWPAKVDGSSFTTKKCLAACEKGGFPFAGTEYGGECWCGVVLANDTAKVHESECSLPCRGDASDKCGGRARLSLFVAKDLESLEPCGHRPVTTSSSSRAVVTTATKPYYKFPNTTTPIVTNPVETTLTADKPSNTSSQSGDMTSSKPVVTVTSTSLYTSSAPHETTTSRAPSESTTGPVASSTSRPGETTASEPQESSSTKSGGTTSSVPEASSSTEAGKTTTTTTTKKPSETSLTGPGETPSSTPYGSTSSSYGSSSSTPHGSTTNKPSQSTDSSAPGETSTPASSSEPSSTTATTPDKVPTASSSKPESSSQSTKPGETPSTSSKTEPSSSTGKTTTPSAPSVTTSSSNAGQPTSSTQSGGSTAPTSSNAGETTSQTKPGETSVHTSSSSRGTTDPSSRPGETTTPTTPPSSTPMSGTTSTTASLCTATSIVPSRCEWQRGNWCAPPLPDWNSRRSCQMAAKTCALQVVSCFKYAGWPHTIDCFEFQRWCRNVQRYCDNNCGGRGRCDKSDAWSKYKPGFGKAPATTTSVFPCLPASETNKPTTTTAKPVTSCPPVPTNICKQPSNDKWGYSPSKPVGGIPLPVVGCNDMRDDWRSRPYKLYTEPDTNKSPSFRWPERPNVCADSCKVQYTQCRDTYVDSCRRLGWKGGFHKRREGETDAEFVRRAQPWSGTWAVESEAADASSRNAGYGSCAPSGDHYSWDRRGSDSVNCWGWGGNTPDKAEQRCRAQYNDCLAVNNEVSPGDQCRTWCRNY